MKTICIEISEDQQCIIISALLCYANRGKTNLGDSIKADNLADKFLAPENSEFDGIVRLFYKE